MMIVKKINYRNIKIDLIVLSLFSFLTGCISLRTDYPEVNYYRLNQIEDKSQNIGMNAVKGTLQIRNFAASDAVDTDNFLGVWDDNKVQIYYYHRWIVNVADLLTDFIITRYNNLRVFEGGVVKSSSIIMPDYILEGQLIDMIAHNSNKSSSPNYVYISLRVSLIKKVPMSTERVLLVNKIFTVKAPRKNNSVETIAPAFSEAVSQIADQMLLEILDAIQKDRE